MARHQSSGISGGGVLQSQGSISLPSLVATPGSDKPLQNTSFYTKVGHRICGIGYYKE
jgi:hypothetical protein